MIYLAMPCISKGDFMTEAYYIKLEKLLRDHFRKYQFTRVGGSLLIVKIGCFQVYVDMNALISYVLLPSVEIDNNYYRDQAKALRLKRKLQHYINRIIKNKHM